MYHSSLVPLLCLCLSCIQLQGLRTSITGLEAAKLELAEKRSAKLAQLTHAIPDWLFDIKDAVVEAIGDPGWEGYQPTHGVVPEWALKLKLEKMEILSIDALEYDLHASHGFVGVNINELRLTIRVYLEELRLVGVLNLTKGDSLGNSFVDAFVKGGLRAGYEQSKESNDWNEVCDETDRLLVFPQLHMRAGFNWVDRLNSVIDKVVRTIVSWRVKKKLRAKMDFLQDSKVVDFLKWHTGVVNATKKFSDAFHQRVKREEKAIHLGKECARMGCKKGGPCDYCGAGYCCKKGSFAGGCNGVDGHPKKRVCVEAPPQPREPKNLGKECWKAGECKNGRCGYCGTGFCCRFDVHGGECSGEVGDRARHVCVAKPYGDEDQQEEYESMKKLERFWELAG